VAKDPNAVALGKLGGSKGGHARCRALSPEQRKDIARHAANVRWNKSTEEYRGKYDDLDELAREYLEDMELLMKENGEEWP
jgi:hypothetical protein